MLERVTPKCGTVKGLSKMNCSVECEGVKKMG